MSAQNYQSSEILLVIILIYILASIYLFNGNTRAMRDISSKLTIKRREQRNSVTHSSVAFIVNLSKYKLEWVNMEIYV